MISQKVRAARNYKKIVGIFLCLLSIFCFIAAVAPPLNVIGRFLRGSFGIFAFIAPFAVFCIGIMLLKTFQYAWSKRGNFYKAIIFVSFFSILQLAFTSKSMGGSLKAYTDAVFGKLSPTGIVLGWLPYCVQKLVTVAGAYVFFVLLAVVFIALLIDFYYSRRAFKRLSKDKPKKYIDAQSGEVVKQGELAQPQQVQTVEEKPVLVTLNAKMHEQAHAAASASAAPQAAAHPKAQAQPSTAELALRQLGLRKDKTVKASDKDSMSLKQLKDFITTPQTVQLPPIITGDAQRVESEEAARQKQKDAERDFLDAIRPVKRVYDASAEQTLKQNYQGPRTINSGGFTAPRDSSAAHNAQRVFGETNAQTQPIIEPQKTQQFRAGSINAATERINAPRNNMIAEEKEPTVLPLPATEIKPTIREEVSDIENRIKNILSSEDFDEKPVKSAEPVIIPNQPVPAIEMPSVPDESAKNFVREEIRKFDVPHDPIIQDDDSASAIDNESRLVRDFREKLRSERVTKPVQESMLGAEPKDKKREAPKWTLSPNSHYNRPPVEILHYVPPVNDEETQDDMLARAEALEQVLASFNVPAKVTDMIKGPTVTRYELQMPPGKTVRLIQGFASDIAMSLAVKGRVRIEAPIPGKSAVGIEIPNSKTSMIGMREIIETPEFQKGSPLTFALGKDVTGSQNMVCDLMDMPHLLVAGSTGSGKSVCLNVMICSLLYKMGPEDLRIILIDPKRVEFTCYTGLPHLIIPEPLIEPKDAVNALIWAVEEMDRRYTLFHSVGLKNIIEYNNQSKIKNGDEEKLPVILIVIDELNDLILTSRKEVEERIRRLTSMARASGIHIVVATQRPSTDVITGTIKSNLPSRIAFQVTNWIDSKTILDQTGAEDLVGRGDMLYHPRSFSEPKRVQCAYISTEETNAIVDYIKTNNEAYFDAELKNSILRKNIVEEKPQADLDGEDEDGQPKLDKDFYKALKLVVETRTASVSLLQRKFSLGYQRAAKIIDQMEQRNCISAQDENKSKPRTVYMTMDEFNTIFPNGEV